MNKPKSTLRKLIEQIIKETTEKVLINRWETRGGKYWLELYKGPTGFTYKNEGGGGSFGNKPQHEVEREIERQIQDYKSDGINLKKVN